MSEILPLESIILAADITIFLFVSHLIRKNLSMSGIATPMIVQIVGLSYIKWRRLLGKFYV